MPKLEVFDPPMCCSTGICGSSADPILVTFASDLEWLKEQGIEVTRHGLTLEPTEFIRNEAVKATIEKEGNSCLPIIVIDDKIALKASYPLREQLAKICHIKYNDDEAPPIHREENCCCGVDCDCSSKKQPEGSYLGQSCDCTNASAEENCFCASSNYEGNVSDTFSNIKKTILLLIILLSVIGVISVKFCCKTDNVNDNKNIPIKSTEMK